MKVLLVNKFHYLKGGSETYYFALAELLRNAGHEVIFFSMKDEKNIYSEQEEYFVSNVDLNVKNISKIIKKVNIFYSFEAKRKIRELLKKEKPDIVHIGLAHKQITLSIIDAIKAEKIPIVFSVHDLIFVAPCYTMLAKDGTCEECIEIGVRQCIKKKCIKDSKLKSIMAFLENKFISIKKLYNKVDLFLTECEFYEDILKKSNFKTRKIMTLPNFLPISKTFEKCKTNGEYFLYFGRFSKEKGIITLLKAYKSSGITTPLYLVGGGPEEVNIRNYIEENKLYSVKLLGYVYGREMEEVLKKAKAIIVPSEWYENCPYTIIESMSKSKIVIASNIAGLKELINDNKTGFLFKVGDIDDLSRKIKIVDNLSGEEQIKMRDSIYNFANEKFNANKYLEKLINIYNDLIYINK